MQVVSSWLGAVRHFGVANVSWSHRTVERMDHEVVEVFHVVLSERRGAPSQQPLVLETVQWAVHSAYRESMEMPPFQMMIG